MILEEEYEVLFRYSQFDWDECELNCGGGVTFDLYNLIYFLLMT